MIAGVLIFLFGVLCGACVVALWPGHSPSTLFWTLKPFLFILRIGGWDDTT